MTFLLAVLLFQATANWGMFNHRTLAADKLIIELTQKWEEARKVIAPDAEAILEFPEGELFVDGDRAIASTTWLEKKYEVNWGGKYVSYWAEERLVTRVDWRMLMRLKPEWLPFVAVHEVCHLLDRDTLKQESISDDTRKKLELRANHCAAIYLGFTIHPQ